jgi:hypothetical protein
MDTEIRQELRQAQDCILSRKSWKGRDLAMLLKSWRRSTLKKHVGTYPLPPLN